MRSGTRIQVLSDLHRDVRPAEAVLSPDANVLVVAGDVCEGVEKALRYLRQVAPAPTPIIFVAGNHEHYHHTIGEGIERGRAVAADLGITFLENEAAVIGGVRFLGCTLWTDYALAGERWADQAMVHARDEMNDHRLITLTKQPWTRFLPGHARAMHGTSRAWLTRALAERFDGPTVVVTHHAPSRRSVHSKYAGQIINAAFASALDSLVEASGAALWVHGHTHSSFDYVAGSTRVLCNPHGYGGENTEFNPALIVEITSDA